MSSPEKKASFISALLPVAFLGVIIFYGLIARPLFLDQASLGLEVIFILASIFSVSQLYFLGFSWQE